MKTRYVFVLAVGLMLGCIADALDARARARRGWVALHAKLRMRAKERA